LQPNGGYDLLLFPRFENQRFQRIVPLLETAHSMLPESAGSRSPGWRCRGVGVASTGSAQAFFACGVLILLNCPHTLCCTAEWWRRECAGEAGRSRRPRQWRVSGTSSTRFHQTEMVQPAVGAATTERWSVRGPGVRLHRLPNEPRMNANAGSSCFPARDRSSATCCLRTAAAGRGGRAVGLTRRREDAKETLRWVFGVRAGSPANA
jgi:hypothetical protein